jgi:hypothetical protein
MKKKIIKDLKREKKLEEKKRTSRIGEIRIKNRKNNVRLPPFHFVYISTMARKTITSQNRSLCDDLGLKWLPGPETLNRPISLFFQQKNPLHLLDISASP